MIYDMFDDKQQRAEDEVWHKSKITKVKCYSPAGDMVLAPGHLPGSALLPVGGLPDLKVVGGYVGDDTWCSTEPSC
eukprot:1642167-Prymnesium_polylepis.1